MQGTRAIGESDKFGKGGSTLRRKALAIGLLAAVAVSATAFGFDAYFSDASGNKISTIWEGGRFCVVVSDPDKGPTEFTADLVIFDFKTGAYIEKADQTFKEFTAGSGLYFWVDGAGNKQTVKVGDRDWDGTKTGFKWTHWLGTSWEGLQADTGAWLYADEDVLGGTSAAISAAGLPTDKEVARVNFSDTSVPDPEVEVETSNIKGRVENMDTLVLIVADDTEVRNIDQDQVKIVDTVATLTVNPTVLTYGCSVCENITVTINDPDENLNCDEVDYVPFFVIINPGSWNQTPSLTGKDFCTLKMYGGVDADQTQTPSDTWNEVIRWYNIYRTNRGVDYTDAPFAANWSDKILQAVFFAHETDINSGVFEYNFGGSLNEFAEKLGLDPDNNVLDVFTSGTTFAFYYLDPNDFDDFTVATAQVGDLKHSDTYLVDANGMPVEEVKIGHTGLYVRVYDKTADLDACCCDEVYVHLCDPHNEDDSEYWRVPEVSANSGGIFSSSGMPLLPVWDAMGGYQLVFDNWKFEAFNEDTILARYNNVVYDPNDLNALGDGNTVSGFPPRIDTTSSDNQLWDVSFDQVKVYDYQVFDGNTHHMRFITCSGVPIIGEVPVNADIGLEVTDLDQNENPLLKEQVFGGWNKDTDTDAGEEDSRPVWDEGDGDLLTPDGAVSGGVEISATSISEKAETVKIFIWNAQRGTWERLDLEETLPNSGIFRSKQCIPVRGGDGTLQSAPGDTIMAFYQDPSNHSDISIISIKVVEAGAVAVGKPTVTFDATQYNPGDTVTITVTDPAYTNLPEISGAPGTTVLVLKDKNGATLKSWSSIPRVSETTNDYYQVTYTLPEEVALGTITATYTDPVDSTRTATATAKVEAAALTDVKGISVAPNPFSASTTFSIQAEPEGAVADKITVTIYDLLGKKVGEVSGSDTDRVTWTGGSLRNGAYIYVAVVEGADNKVWTFRGFVYIKR